MSASFSLLIVYVVTSLLYFPLNHRKSHYYWKTRFDDFVPRISSTIWIYVLHYPYIFTSLAYFWGKPEFVPLVQSLIIGTVLATLFWFVWANGVKREPYAKPAGELTLSERLINLTYKEDGDTNGFPSAHVFTSLLCAYPFVLSLANPFEYGMVAMGVMIAISTVTTKQHYVVDVLGGIVMVVIARGLVGMVF